MAVRGGGISIIDGLCHGPSLNQVCEIHPYGERCRDDFHIHTGPVHDLHPLVQSTYKLRVTKDVGSLKVIGRPLGFGRISLGDLF